MKKRRRTALIASIVAAFYVAGILATVHAVMTTRTAPGAITWSVSLVSMPFIAVPAYLVLGRSKFEGMVEVYEDRKDEIDATIAEFEKNQEPWIVLGSENCPEYEAVRNLVSTELTRGNEAELLINGDATFDSILAGPNHGAGFFLPQTSSAVRSSRRNGHLVMADTLEYSVSPTESC